jgi:Putative prokaryotic signal transducing protein
MDTNEPVEVYAAYSPGEAEIIRGMLEAEGIQADVAGDAAVGGIPGATPEVTIMVHAGDADRARELIRAHQEAAANEPTEA